MNVQEQELQEKIDPHLTPANLSVLANLALGTSDSVEGYRVLTGGCWNRVIGIKAGETDLVAKISPKLHDKALEREYAVLDVFAERTNLPVATPYHVDLEGSIIPGSVLIESLVPGDVMHHVFGYLDPASRERVGDEIADYLADLHTIRGSGFGGVELSDEDRLESWPEFWIPRLVQVVDKVAAGDYISEKYLEDIREVIHILPSILDIGDTGTMTHYDIWSGNVMIDVKTDQPHVTGFIDIPGYFADYAREISFMHVFGMADQRFFERYTRRHTLDTTFELRLNAYSLRTHLQHITMYPTESYYRDGALRCLRHIQEHSA